MKFSIKHTLATLAPLAALALTFASCSDGFLDREPDGAYITDDQLQTEGKWNVNIMLGQVNGTTHNLLKWGAGGTTNHSDFGQKSVDLATDIMAGDIVFPQAASYGWFSADAQLYNNQKNMTGATSTWRYYYNVIYSANVLFQRLGSDTAVPENDEKAVYFASAKTVRAYAYFKLAQLYSRSYELSKDKKTLPIYREVSEEYAAPQTIDSVYRFVHEDLETAINAFSDHGVPTGIDMPGLDVAYTLNAYAYLEQGDYEQAYENAANAIQSSDKQILSASNLYNGFNSVDNTNWMWGVDITAENTGALCTFWGHIDWYTYSYAYAGDAKVINGDLYAQIPDTTDARIDWFLYAPYEDYESFHGLPTGKFHTAMAANAYANKLGYVLANDGKSYTYAAMDRSWESDIHFMRIEEPYMIAAEAAARMGETATAASILSEILAERDTEKAAALATMSNEQLLDEIYFEWRIEFWGEGKALQTLKRFKKTMVRPANDYYYTLTTSNGYGPIPYDDDKLMYAIPQRELDYNPYMKDAQQ